MLHQPCFQTEGHQRYCSPMSSKHPAFCYILSLPYPLCSHIDQMLPRPCRQCRPYTSPNPTHPQTKVPACFNNPPDMHQIQELSWHRYTAILNLDVPTRCVQWALHILSMRLPKCICKTWLMPNLPLADSSILTKDSSVSRKD